MTSIAIDLTDGLSSATAIKGPCRVATTANIALSGEQTIDGVAAVTGDRVLVKDQTTQTENGIYVADTGAWRRAKDFSGNRDIRRGTKITVTDGGGAGDYRVAASNPITIDTSDISFVLTLGGAALGAGVGTFLATPTSANLKAAVTDETGSGALVFANTPTLVTPVLGAATGTSLNLSGLTASSAVATDGSKNLVSVTNTGSGNNVLATSPTLVTPALGTPSAAVLTNATGLPILTGVSGLATSMAAFLAGGTSAQLAAALTDETGSGANVFATSPTLVTPILGTPTSVTLTNATGLPVSTGISGLGVGVAAFLATPSSANLITAVTDETGTGSLVFSTNAALVTPNLGTPSAVTLTNGTGLPIASGVSGLGTGVATFLATPSSANLRAALTDETGTGIAYFVGGALGTPSSATLTNATGLPVSSGVSGLGTGVATFLATPSSANLISAVTDETGTGALVFATSPTLVTPVLGTPTSATLTNATGLPITTGVSGLAAGVATFLATPSSANLLAAVTDETGTGALVFATAPTFTTSLTSPIVIGGTGAASTAEIRATSGAGVGSELVKVTGGNNGATLLAQFTSATTSIGSGAITTGALASTGDVSIELGGGRTGSGNAYIDFHTTSGSDFEFRILRDTGANGNVTFNNAGSGYMSFSGSVGRLAPVTKTADFTVAATENWLINNKAAATCTVTLPAAASFSGREIMIKNIQAFTVVSATSNVVPLAGGAATTAILAATAGKWATLVSDGTNWIIMQAA
jgi:uncharacterized cupin superfamily protein